MKKLISLLVAVAIMIALIGLSIAGPGDDSSSPVVSMMNIPDGGPPPEGQIIFLEEPVITPDMMVEPSDIPVEPPVPSYPIKNLKYAAGVCDAGSTIYKVTYRDVTGFVTVTGLQGAWSRTISNWNPCADPYLKVERTGGMQLDLQAFISYTMEDCNGWWGNVTVHAPGCDGLGCGEPPLLITFQFACCQEG